MYLDPSEGKAGQVLDTVYGAATSGALKVDPQTGETTLRFLNQVQDLVDRMQRAASAVAVDTPLGGGFGTEVGRFNGQLATGSAAAKDMLTRFNGQLELLKDAVAKSMESYRSTDTGNARTITAAGGSR